ncbi:MAG: hypothetical protein J6V49_02850 [Bacteroidales bacterium]|nr:hypothetical protein [Bacteroidales bacterium]MBP5709891.1 hypothetical protein [Bacteroidales bacterium]
MNIIRTNIDVSDKKAVYKLTKAESQRVQDVEKGLSLPVDKWAVYTETKKGKNGEETEQTVLAIVSGGMKISTISNTFIDSFMEVVDIMDGDPFSIIITGGTSKGGRQFVNCELDCD